MKRSLTERGIPESLARQMGWHANPNNWTYPIFDLDGVIIGYRFKAMDSSATMKYWWHPETKKPDHACSDWYILPNTKQAIETAGGVVFVVNGELSTLSHHTAQVYNTIATTLSEVAVPKNILSMLHGLGVSHVKYLADHDKPGEDAAANWRDALSGSGIHFEAFDWGADKAKGYDSNDAWLACGQSIEAYQVVLGNLKALDLPAPEPKREYSYDDSTLEETPEGLRQALGSALGITGYKSDGWSRKHVSSPFRDDKHPSMTYNIHSGVGYDWGTLESYGAITIAKQLGIDWQRFYPEQPKQYKEQPIDIDFHNKVVERIEWQKERDIRKAERIEKRREERAARQLEIQKEQERLSQFNFEHTWIAQEYLPETWVRACLGLAVSNSATVPVLLRLHRAFITREIDPCHFTRADVHRIMGNRRQSTVAALETLVKWNFVRFLPTNIKENTSDKNLTKGRPNEFIYAIDTPNTDLIRATLSEMMNRKLVELVGKRAMVPRELQLGYELGLTREETIEWQARCKATTDKSSQYILDTLKDYWYKQLWDDTPLIIEDFENARDIRVHMLTAMVAKEESGLQIANARLAMLLGCSESNLSSVYEAANIESHRMRDWYKVEVPNDCNLDEEIKKAQQEKQGVVLAINLQLDESIATTKNGWTGLIYGESAWYSHVTMYQYKIKKLWIMVEQPSLLQFKEDEVDDETIRDQVETVVSKEIATEKPAKSTQSGTVSKPRQKSYPQSGKTDRDWTRFDHKFIQRQLAIEAHVLTQDGQFPEGLTLKQAWHWIQEHAELKPVRSIESFFQQDTGDSTLIDLAKQLGGQQMLGLAAVDYEQFDSVPISEYVGHVEASAADSTPTIHIVPEERNPYAIEKRAYPKPSEAVIQMMIEHWRKSVPTQTENRFRKGA